MRLRSFWLIAEILILTCTAQARDGQTCEVETLKLDLRRELQAPPASRPPSATEDLSTLLSLVRGETDPKKIADAMYSHSEGLAPISAKVARDFRDVETVFRNFGIKRTGQRGDSVLGETRARDTVTALDGWVLFDFLSHGQRGAPSKVYVSIPPEMMRGELQLILNSAVMDNATGVKVAASREKLARPDRLMVYFRNPVDASLFAARMAQRYERMGVAGNRVPLSLPALRDKPGPVAVGSDVFSVSARKELTRIIAEAVANCAEAQRLQCARTALERAEIDLETWLPKPMVNDVRRNLYGE